jgi:hypothetical protein
MTTTRETKNPAIDMWSNPLDLVVFTDMTGNLTDAHCKFPGRICLYVTYFFDISNTARVDSNAPCAQAVPKP